MLAVKINIVRLKLMDVVSSKIGSKMMSGIQGKGNTNILLKFKLLHVTSPLHYLVALGVLLHFFVDRVCSTTLIFSGDVSLRI